MGGDGARWKNALNVNAAKDRTLPRESYGSDESTTQLIDTTINMIVITRVNSHLMDTLQNQRHNECKYVALIPKENTNQNCVFFCGML
jgi:hypothetical protein